MLKFLDNIPIIVEMERAIKNNSHIVKNIKKYGSINFKISIIK